MEKQTTEDIFTYYAQDVYHYLLVLTRNHHQAEDILQETFLRAYLHLPSYRGERVKAWLLTVAYRAFIDMQRKESRVQHLHDETMLPSGARSVEEKILHNETIQELRQEIQQLPHQQRHAVLLVDFQELSYMEATAILDMSLPLFKTALFRGRQKLRKWRAKHEG
ncbi:sigma-70 family RNA polymerase sigma factor [Aureibacillus halotolerans]|uniref:RNA polymerase sigma factor n=1 Tax=Aureibacillus halotolerans TaxID=1508390 RepID=A0A4R6U6V4_9BACI|nr:sigma-70 family RNA polymerase sigma factor [Aureibacillus halotolerans]TDQ42031.1 RNA polymerase sigma-70 factor (ECF subfamily) [Aureibacillus halotolerans]